MPTIEYETIIHASQEMVYETSQDYSICYSWDPFPEKIELLGGARSIDKGTRVLVLAKSGMKMIVEFVQVAPPSTAAIKMVEGPFFLQSFARSWVFKPDGNSNTKARFVYSIKAKKWALPFVTEFIGSRYFAKAVKHRLDGLKAYCELRALNRPG